ncbi:restriction endonuclease subunit S [Vibrio lentus]|uniref:restriction endonuclease subunit S n=1 Tax=Vibrio lentus TaxID=136468 RepID=UPI000C840FED|nr:restriction endonuclease subunit S [Vibrio lentus]PMI62522.1 hypothetical protein BCU40_05180 [Vibrio lentus]
MTALSETKRYQVYPEYKDSGVDWVGSIPSHWIVTSLKRYTYVKGGFAFSSDLFGDVGKPVIRIGDIKQDGSISLESCKYVPEVVAENSQECLVSNGQLLMAMTGATIGKAGIYSGKYPALVNQRVGRFEVYDDKLSYRFLWYVLKTLGYQEYIRLTAFGGAQPNISDTAMVAYDSAFPPLDEQTKIASFLDHETAKIDILIDKQQQLIKLLKEKRQSVINHTVTKGLNPDAPMKDTEVEWFGSIPSHWKVMELKFSADDGYKTFTDGDWIESPYITDSGVRLLQTGNVGTGFFKEKGFRYISESSFSKLNCTEVKPNDVLICRLDGPVGRSCLAPNLGVKVITSVDNAILKPSNNFDPRFIVYLTNSEPWLRWVQDLCRVGGGFRLRISRTMLGEQRIPVPPFIEQVAIADMLDKLSEKHLICIDRAEQSIRLLHERRVALISEVVTGKIDVRNWQALEKEVTQQEAS